MRAWSTFGMIGAAISLATVAVCLWWVRAKEPRASLHWVSYLGSMRAPRRVRRVFRGGLTVGAALYGAFAIAWLRAGGGLRADLAAAAFAIASGALATLALCPMDVRPAAHVAGALGYFTFAVTGGAIVALPPRTGAQELIAGTLLGGAIAIVPLFALSLRHTLGRPLAEVERYFTEETDINRWVRTFQHLAVGVTGILLFLVALSAHGW